MSEDILLFLNTLKTHFQNISSSVLVLYSLSPYTLNFAGRIRSQVLKPNLEQGRPPSLLPKFTYPSTQRPISQTYNIEIVETLIAQNDNYMEPWDDICDKQ